MGIKVLKEPTIRLRYSEGFEGRMTWGLFKEGNIHGLFRDFFPITRSDEENCDIVTIFLTTVPMSPWEMTQEADGLGYECHAQVDSLLAVAELTEIVEGNLIFSPKCVAGPLNLRVVPVIDARESPRKSRKLDLCFLHQPVVEGVLFIAQKKESHWSVKWHR